MLPTSSLVGGLLRKSVAGVHNFHSSAVALGRPWKRRNSNPIVHGSQKRAETANIDFKELGLTYPINEIPTLVIKQHAWAPQPKELPSLPFMIDRTEIGMSLPVYTEYRGGGTKVLTILRKIRGDVDALRGEVEKVVGKKVDVRLGKIEIDGNYNRRLKLWLLGLGF